MDGELRDTIVLLASLVVVVLIIQTVLMLVFVTAFRKWCIRTEALLAQISQNLEPVLGATRELIIDTRQQLSSVTQNLNDITLLAKSQMARVDSFVQDTTERAHLQVIRLDQMLGDAAHRVEETTRAVQHGVLGPIHEITALVAGVRATLDFLLRRNRGSVERATNDEEMFI